MTVQVDNQQIRNNIPMYATGVYTPQVSQGTDGGSVATSNMPLNVPANGSTNGCIYNYPSTSIYGKPSSGVTIQIFNPSAIGAPNSTSVSNSADPQLCYPNAPMPVINNNNNNNNNNEIPQQDNAQQSLASTPLANTPIKPEESKDKKKDKQIVALTDTYIKTLENYIKSPDKKIRKNGIVDLIKRFEEDSSRYNDPALTALLNISLKDPSPANRMLAMSAIAGELATGDETTIQLLDNLQKSDKMYGQEAQMATEALLKAAQTKTKIPAE